jgi:DNA invertase Pin-like site-specific DNA recombinase
MVLSMQKALAYIRRSAPGASLSYAEQRDAVTALAARHGNTTLDELVENGRSGADAKSAFGGTGRGGNRRAYRDLRERIAQGGVSVVYAYNLSRLARSTRELLDLAEACADTGTVLRTVKEGEQNFTTPSGRLFLTLLGAIAAFEAESASDRTHDRVAGQRERGEYVGRPPYGFRIKGGKNNGGGPLTLVPIASEQAVIRRVKKTFATSRTYEATAKALNAAGVKSPTGIWWRSGTVRRVLDRQGILGTRLGRRPGSRALASAIFVRLLYCNFCDGLLSPKRKFRGGRDWTAYQCTRARFEPQHPRPQMVSEQVVLDWARRETARMRIPYDELVVREQDEKQRAVLEGQRGRLVDLRVDDRISRADYDRRVGVIDAQIAELEARERVVDIPKAIDWSRPPAAVQPVLAAMWRRVVVNLSAKTFEAEWTVPEWRADESPAGRVGEHGAPPAA